MDPELTTGSAKGEPMEEVTSGLCAGTCSAPSRLTALRALAQSERAKGLVKAPGLISL